MRWDNLRLLDPSGDGGDAGTPLPLFEQGAVVRTFDTPEFRGVTFYEVRAKSIINRVPEASRVPFRWTINPYRGCTHACSYCMSGDTPVLMADGSTKPLAELRVGDRIYGTVREGRYRHYVTTEVLAHWSTVKPALRVVLEDGTELVASGDHRFLTGRGWKHVTGRMAGAGHRPYLTLNSELRGAGRAARERTTFDGQTIERDAKLRVVQIEPLGVDLPMFDITTGTGDFIANGVVSHNCFARNTHTYLDMDYGEDFDSQIVVKINAPELLRKELAKRTWTGEHIAMGTNVDPYQRAEGRYRLMRGILETLVDAANPFSILTKGSLILRDLDLLEKAADVTDVGANVSVGSVDRDLWRAVESGTPSPQKRLEVCSKLNDVGVGCGVLMAPILPFLSDSPSQLEATVKAISETGATHITPIVLHLRPGAREWYMAWLSREHPALVPRYQQLYGRGSYAPKAFQQTVSARVHDLAVRYGIGRANPKEARGVGARKAPGKPPPRPEAEQLPLL
jgi:DNA repair photolyase